MFAFNISFATARQTFNHVDRYIIADFWQKMRKGWRNGYLWKPQERIAKELGVEQSYVSRRIRRLVRLGFLSITRKWSPGRCQRYMLNLDAARECQIEAINREAALRRERQDQQAIAHVCSPPAYGRSSFAQATAWLTAASSPDAIKSRFRAACLSLWSLVKGAIPLPGDWTGQLVASAEGKGVDGRELRDLVDWAAERSTPRDFCGEGDADKAHPCWEVNGDRYSWDRQKRREAYGGAMKGSLEISYPIEDPSACINLGEVEAASTFQDGGAPSSSSSDPLTPCLNAWDCGAIDDEDFSPPDFADEAGGSYADDEHLDRWAAMCRGEAAAPELPGPSFTRPGLRRDHELDARLWEIEAAFDAELLDVPPVRIRAACGGCSIWRLDEAAL